MQQRHLKSSQQPLDIPILPPSKSSKCAGQARQSTIVNLSSEKSFMLLVPSLVDLITIITPITLITTLNEYLSPPSDQPDQSVEHMSLRAPEQVKQVIAARHIDITEIS
ncbi:hypothetical protein EYC80_003199 [Monilinia laxa]|uniref:Uncharacterized protein n=1 Tax=Monilinia laxa TaxID=61186 RepID=A0A5N6KD31_MONLA|nr:hypothetical protein EYC80_003199 [Monilinia laxa]